MATDYRRQFRGVDDDPALKRERIKSMSPAKKTPADQVDADEREIRKMGLVATAGLIRADREQRERETSEREQIARTVERLYGPHDKRFKTAIEIADAIRRGADQ